MRLDIPGLGRLELDHLVLDFNGTLAVDGRLAPGVARRLRALAPLLRLHVLTADTFGGAGRALAGLPCRLAVLRPGRQAEAKARYVRRLGAARTACIGNGRNDRLMLRAAALGIAVILAEGAAAEALRAADIVVGNIGDALDLLLRPLRLAATLRS
jgi:soluble P-type ATPase